MMTALEVMGLPLTASKEEVVQRKKELLQKHHPDKGGDVDQFIYWKEISIKALEQVEKKKCLICNGTGKVLRNKGFYYVYTNCSCRSKMC